MAATIFQRNSPEWQLFQWFDNLGQWWEVQVKQWTQWIPELPQVDRLAWLDTKLAEQIFKALSFALVLALLLWLALKLAHLIEPWLQQRLRQWQETRLPDATAASSLTVTDWLKRSHLYQRQGDLYQACRCLYLGMLEVLHERDLIPHQSSRSDGEYLRLLPLLPQPEPCQQLFEIHQYLCFGGGTPSDDLLTTAQQAFEQLHASPPPRSA